MKSGKYSHQVGQAPPVKLSEPEEPSAQTVR